MKYQPFRNVRVEYNSGAARLFGRGFEDIPVVIPERILVFSPHPDDETISCGGTIYKYGKILGSDVTVLLVKETGKSRLREFTLALGLLGCDTRRSRCLGLDIDGGIDERSELGWRPWPKVACRSKAARSWTSRASFWSV